MLFCSIKYLVNIFVYDFLVRAGSGRAKQEIIQAAPCIQALGRSLVNNRVSLDSAIGIADSASLKSSFFLWAESGETI